MTAATSSKQQAICRHQLIQIIKSLFATTVVLLLIVSGNTQANAVALPTSTALVTLPIAALTPTLVISTPTLALSATQGVPSASTIALTTTNGNLNSSQPLDFWGILIFLVVGFVGILGGWGIVALLIERLLNKKDEKDKERTSQERARQAYLNTLSTQDANGYIYPLGAAQLDLRLPIDAVHFDLRAMKYKSDKTRGNNSQTTNDTADSASQTANDTADNDAELSKNEQQLKDVLVEHPNIVILGEPGAGKTTLLRWLVNREIRRSEVFANEGSRVPIFIPLTDVAACTNEQLTDTALYDTVISLVIKRQGGENKGVDKWLEKILTENRAYILLDSLDEVDPTRRAMVASWITRLLSNDLDSNRVIVTCRTQIREVEYLPADVPRFVISGMKPSERPAFVTTLFKVACKNGLIRSFSIEEAENKAQIITNQINTSPMVGLAQIPLLLSLMAFTWDRAGGRLPLTRAELYTQAVRVMIERRGFKDKWLATEEIEDREKILYRYLPTLAYCMHQQAAPAVTKEQVQSFLLEKFTGEGEIIAKLWQMLVNESGLFRLWEEKTGNKPATYTFLHRTFEEYFAGRYLIASSARQATMVRQHIHADWWREAILFAISYLSIDAPDQADELVRTAVLREDEDTVQLPERPTDDYEDWFHTDLLFSLLAYNQFKTLTDRFTHNVKETLERVFRIYVGYKIANRTFNPIRRIEVYLVAVAQGPVGDLVRTLLIERIQGGRRPEETSSAIDLLALISKGNREVSKALISRLDNEPNQYLWRHIVEALARVGADDEEVVERFIALLQPSCSEFHRTEAAKSLANVKTYKERVVDALLQVALLDASTLVRSTAIATLGLLATGNEIVANQLATKLNDEKDTSITNALRTTLVRLDVSSDEVFNFFIGRLGDEDNMNLHDQLERGFARQALATLTKGHSNFAEKLLVYVGTDRRLRLDTAIILCTLFSTNTEVRESVLDLLRHGDVNTRESIIGAIYYTGVGGNAVVDVLVDRLLNDDSDIVRQLSAGILMIKTNRLADGEIVESLHGGVSENTRSIQSNNVSIDGHLLDSELIQRVIGIVADEKQPSEVRQPLMQLLGNISHHTNKVEDISDVLTERFKNDKDKYVRLASSVSLSRLGNYNAQAINALYVGLGDEYYMVRDASATSLSKLGWEDNSITQKLVDLLNDEHDNVRFAAVVALDSHQISTPKMREVLLSVINDLKLLSEKAVIIASKIAAHDDDMTMALTNILQGNDYYEMVRQWVLKALADINKIDTSTLLQLVQHAPAELSRDAMEILEKAGQRNTIVKQTLWQMMTGENDNTDREHQRIAYDGLFYLLLGESNKQILGGECQDF